MKKIFIVIAFLLSIQLVQAQTQDDRLKLLTRKGTITNAEADSISNAYVYKNSRSDKSDTLPIIYLGNNLRVTGFTQFRYQYYQQSGKNSEFDIRRARLDFQGNFGKKWDYRLLTDFVGASGAAGSAPTGGALLSPTLLDAYIAFKPVNNFKITAGQFVMPFSLENLTPDRTLETIDRSQVVNALVGRKGDASNGLVDSIGNQNGRDIGLVVSGNFFKTGEKTYFLDYYFGLLSGAGINTVDNNQSKDFISRLVFHPTKELSFGGSFYDGNDRFTSSVTKDQSRIRWGAELAYKHQLFALTSEYLRGQEADKNPIVHEGWYAQASYYLVPKKLQGVLKYDTYNSNINKYHQTNTYYIFGVNYLFNAWSKLQVNYSWRTESGTNIANDLLTAQLQLAF